LNFINKRSNRLISRSLRNKKQDHLRSISGIEDNDHYSNDEINDFLALEDPDNHCLRNETTGQTEKYDFISILPPFMKGQEEFYGISHDLKEATKKHGIPIVEYFPPQPTIAPVHCDSCFDWVECYYRDIPLLQE